MWRNAVLLGSFLGIAILFPGCGGSMTPTSNPTPTILSLSPSSVPVGSGNFTLGIMGSGFLSTSEVRFGNDTLPAVLVLASVVCRNFGPCEELQATVPAKDVAPSGAINVSVANASLVSNSAAFTVMPSVTNGGAPADGTAGSGGTEGSTHPVISPDGRFVAFASDDTNLVAGATSPVTQVYLRDTCESIIGAVASCTPQTTLLTLGADGKPGNAASENPTISSFGLFVAYQSTATNLTSTAVPAGVQQVYLSQSCPTISFPGQPGGPLPGCTAMTSVASLDASGKPGNKDSINPSLDLTGLSLAFESLADDIVANMPGNGFHQVYLRSLCLNLPIPTTGGTPPCSANGAIGVSVDTQGNLGTGGDSVTPSAGPLGAAVAFASTATNLVAGGSSGSLVFVRNTCGSALPQPLGCTPQTNFVPVANAGTAAQLIPSSNPVISFNNHVAFGAVLGPPSNASDQLVVGAAVVCFGTTATCVTLSSPVVVSNGAHGSPTGAMNLAFDGAGLFVTFSGTPVNSTLGTSPEIFLAALFLF